MDFDILDRTGLVVLAGANSDYTNSTANFGSIGPVSSNSYVDLTHIFSYVNTTATKEQWDRAEFLFYPNETIVGTDGAIQVQVDYLGFDLVYEPAPTASTGVAVGDTLIDGAYLGSESVDRLYLGNNLLLD